MKRIIIADFISQNNHGFCMGHFYALASNYRDVFSHCFEVKIAGGPVYLKKFKEEDMVLLPYDCISGDSKLKNLFRMILNARKIFKQVGRDDVVIVQQSQPAKIMFALLLAYCGKGNVYQIQYSEEPMRRLTFRLMMKLARAKIKGLICPNDIVGKAYGIPYIVVPDYIYVDRENLTSFNQFDSKQFDFAFVGRIAQEKGVLEAVNAMAGKKYSMIVAGKPENKSIEDAIKMSAAQSSNIEIKFEYVSDEDYDYYIKSSYYCILNYQDDYAERSSGVVLDTIFRGVPVVGRRCRALEFIEKNNLGVLYDDIFSFDFSSLLSDRVYKVFLDSIESYKQSFADYRKKMIKFVTVE